MTSSENPRTAKAEFSVNPGYASETRCVGHSKRTVLVLDNFLAAPTSLVNFACDAPSFQSISSDLYPGIRKQLPPVWGRVLADALTDVVKDAFVLPSQRIARSTFSALSLTTQSADTVLPIQRIPHFDTSSTDQFAVVIYLSKSNLGGTSFYRHRSTGFETIGPAQARQYAQALEREAKTRGLPEPEFIDGDTDLFQRTASIDSRFNRAVIYRSNMLHSGNIGTTLSTDPAKGRLTANFFVNFTPA